MIKQLLTKWGLWEESDARHTEITSLYHEALRHYCRICNRWFAATRGKLMHDRHRHK